MTQPSVDIEKVVREVLAEFGLAPKENPSAGAGTPPSSVPAAPGAVQPSPQPSPKGRGETDVETSPKGSVGSGSEPSPKGRAGAKDGELILSGRVITLADVADGLSGVQRVVVGPQAIVTPAVRDELLRKNVTLICGGPEPPEPAGKVRLLTIATGISFDPAGLIRVLVNEGIEAQLQTLDCLIAAVDTFVVELAKERTLGLLLTRHTAAAVCLANRVRGVRAVWGVDAGSVVRDAAAVGANLLVADPAAAGLYQLRQMVVQFCRQGPRECPDVFRKRLG